MHSGSIDFLGLQPYAPHRPPARISSDNVHLVCWLAVVKRGRIWVWPPTGGLVKSIPVPRISPTRTSPDGSRPRRHHQEIGPRLANTDDRPRTERNDLTPARDALRGRSDVGSNREVFSTLSACTGPVTPVNIPPLPIFAIRLFRRSPPINGHLEKIPTEFSRRVSTPPLIDGWPGGPSPTVLPTRPRLPPLDP